MHIFVYIVDICSGYGNMGITYKHRSLGMKNATVKTTETTEDVVDFEVYRKIKAEKESLERIIVKLAKALEVKEGH